MNILLGRTFRLVLESYINSSKQISVRTKKIFSSTSIGSIGDAGGTAQKKDSDERVKITLVQQNQSIVVTTLKEAQKIAKRRDLHLQKLNEKTRPTYKFVTAREMILENLDDTSVLAKRKKSEKSLTIGSRITEHDLASRLKQISKWLIKNHEVYVLIQGSPEEIGNSERIEKAIEKSIKEPQTIGKITQRSSRGSNIKFNILPQQSVASSKEA